MESYPPSRFLGVYCMSREEREKKFPRLWSSKRGIAIPVTFLMLFVSLTLVISATYYFAVAKISAKGELLNISAAKQSMLLLDDSIGFVAWSSGTSEVFHLEDCGGEFKSEPTAKRLVINLTDDTFYDVIFNSSIGKVAYELSPSESPTTGIFLRGDSRVVVNQSSSTMTQLYISMGTKRPEITLCYRPLASSSTVGSSGGKPVNSLRIYILNLNSSQNLALRGELYLKLTCLNVTSTVRSYNFSYPITSLMIKADLDGVEGEVSLPISSTAEGAIVNVETVTCNIRLQRAKG